MQIPLTVVIPAFSRPGHLQRALSSIAAQDVRPRQVVVVDDGSDPPLSIPCNLLEGTTLSVLRQPVNRGAAAARNLGLRAADSDWIAFLDCDDCLLPGSLRLRWAMVQERSRDAHPLTIFGCGWVEDEPGRSRPRTRVPREAHDPRAFASGCWFSPGSCVMMNRAAILEQGVFQDEALRRLEDLDWFLELALRGARLRVLDAPLVLIERGRSAGPRVVEGASEYLRQKWKRRALDPISMSRLLSYLDLECASANFYHGYTLRSARYICRSFARIPRTSIQLSPGWR